MSRPLTKTPWTSGSNRQFVETISRIRTSSSVETKRTVSSSSPRALGASRRTSPPRARCPRVKVGDRVRADRVGQRDTEGDACGRVRVPQDAVFVDEHQEVRGVLCHRGHRRDEPVGVGWLLGEGRQLEHRSLVSASRRHCASTQCRNGLTRIPRRRPNARPIVPLVRSPRRAGITRHGPGRCVR